MSTTQKTSIRGLKIGADQLKLLGETVTELVGSAGTVTIKEEGSQGLQIRSHHNVRADSKFADIKIRFHGATADVGIYVEKDGQIGMAWDNYVVRGNQQLKDAFEGRQDRNTFENNLNAMFVAKTFEQTAIKKGFSSSGVNRVSLRNEKMGQFELTLDTGFSNAFSNSEQKNTLSGSLGGGL
tara:strand:- start:449 stop:994 length:546 start_codon:yes stop_codon:yes gene_type:complete